MLKSELQNIKPISQKDLDGFLKDLRTTGQSVGMYGAWVYGLYLVDVEDYSRNDCNTRHSGGVLEEPIKFYYRSGDPSCILSRMQGYKSPFKCFLGYYNKIGDFFAIFNSELTVEQVSQTVTAFSDFCKERVTS